MSYSFRLRFNVSDNKRLGVESNMITVFEKDQISIILKSKEEGKVIKESLLLVLLGRGYQTEELALAAGEVARDKISIALAELDVPANFGDRVGPSFLTVEGLEMLTKQ